MIDSESNLASQKFIESLLFSVTKHRIHPPPLTCCTKKDLALICATPLGYDITSINLFALKKTGVHFVQRCLAIPTPTTSCFLTMQ